MSEQCRILQVGLPELLDMALEEQFRRAGWKSDWVQTATEGLRALDSGGFEVLVFSTAVADPLPERLAEEALRCRHAPAVLALSRQPDYSEACRLARFGVVDYLGIPEEEPFPLDWIEERVRLAWEDRAASDAAKDAEGAEPRLVGESELMRSVRRLIGIVAPRRSTILICGPTGTGKELAAKAIHGASPRAGQPLVTVNCGAIPESLMEAELFGHVKGAFSGAIANRTGRFEQAHKGTIFLDEVGEMPHDMQAKLLRVLQEREFQRVGSSETTAVDVRVVAATNRDLDEMVERGEFREDLYYRLNVIPISLPTLGRRLEDVPGWSSTCLSVSAPESACPKSDSAPTGSSDSPNTTGRAMFASLRTPSKRRSLSAKIDRCSTPAISPCRAFRSDAGRERRRRYNYHRPDLTSTRS